MGGFYKTNSRTGRECACLTPCLQSHAKHMVFYPFWKTWRERFYILRWLPRPARCSRSPSHHPLKASPSMWTESRWMVATCFSDARRCYVTEGPAGTVNLMGDFRGHLCHSGRLMAWSAPFWKQTPWRSKSQAQVTNEPFSFLLRYPTAGISSGSTTISLNSDDLILCSYFHLFFSTWMPEFKVGVVVYDGPAPD